MYSTSVKPSTGTKDTQKKNQAKKNGRPQLALYRHNTAVVAKADKSGSQHHKLSV